MKTKIKEIKSSPDFIGKEVCIKGWVRTVREQKTFAFIEVNDGSTLSNMQVVVNEPLTNMSTGAAIAITGKVVESPAAKQKVEIQASKIEVLGVCDPESYPLQKKRHSFEFLRGIAHIRPRTNTIGAVMRVRNLLAYETHRFFQQRGFFYLHTPIITASDCEGAGKMFQVSSLDCQNPPRDEKGNINHSLDFFGKEAYLTVSGQLNAESYACALSDVYTFGPTFRAENSNTSRHLAEFWMIEPEMAFADIDDDMDLAESYLKWVFGALLKECPEEMEFFDAFIKKGVIERLNSVVSTPFERITYSEAIEILKKSQKNFQFSVEWGCDLQSEHERYLCEEHFKKPVIVRNYPKQIKAFYMRNNDDGKTVAAMDVLVPDVGEIIGGSQREERYDVLQDKMREHDLVGYEWYLDLRKYGSCPHAGFGAGFERLLLFSTGMENIRDVIAFPRYPGHCEY